MFVGAFDCLWLFMLNGVFVGRFTALFICV